MFLIALSLLSGILSLSLFTELPGNALYFASIVTGAAWFLKRDRCYRKAARSLFLFMIGMSWAQFHAIQYLQRVLPEPLAGRDIVITGKVCDIPVNDATLQRFILEVENFDAGAYKGAAPGRVKLSWYYGQPVRAGETWRLNVRLKPPHGFMNPGGFDYEAWLFQRGIHATGYVRDSEQNQRLAGPDRADSGAIRQRIAETIASALHASDYGGLVTALAVGDRAGISAGQWRVLINTGTNHLMAISGLHIGLAAAFGFGLCRRLAPVRLMRYLPAQHFAMVGAVVIAALYAMLAGFAIPTQRALLMLLVVAGANLYRRTTRPMDVLFTALILVLARDPGAVMSAGFWFSFMAVAAIFYTMTGELAQSRWLRWGWLQIVIALALFPLSLFMFQQVSLVSPLANLFLVPYVSLLVVPLVLLGLVLAPVSVTAAELLFICAGGLFQLVWPLLQWLSEMPGSLWIGAQPGLMRTVLALAGVAILLAPRIRYWRPAGAVLILPVLLSQPESPVEGAFELTALDVGQGLAVVVTTHSRTLVYDTGARFSERLDSGEAVLLPFLRHRGIDRIDRLVISHGDGDHIGGAATLMDAYPGTPVLGQGIDQLGAPSKQACRAGQRWEWDGVVFTVLHPDDGVYSASNNRSCVLKIDAAGGSVLLAGDIEKKVEARLVREVPDELEADVLIAPHHGSNTSSTTRFIEAVSPRSVIFAAGYRNRYHFPTRKVVERYLAQGARMHTTGLSGAIRVVVDPRGGIPVLERYRENHGKYWHHRLSGLRQDG
jgi:competence protein ComEC